MFSIGLLELIILLALALIVLGPKNLLQISKDVAQIIYRLKSVKEDIRQQITDSPSSDSHQSNKLEDDKK